MALLGFKKQFAPKILDRSKNWTVRSFRKIPIRPGERLYLYTGLRTKFCDKIGEALCLWTSIITIRKTSIVIKNYGGGSAAHAKYSNDGNADNSGTLDQFAQRDGFADWKEMKAFWVKTHDKKSGKPVFPFKGTIIRYALQTESWK